MNSARYPKPLTLKQSLIGLGMLVGGLADVVILCVLVLQDFGKL